MLLLVICWLCLHSIAPCENRPYTSKAHHFSVLFHGPVKVAHPRADQVTFGREPSEGQPNWEAVSVLTGRLRKRPRETLNYLVSEGVLRPHAGPVKDILFNKFKGIEVTGLDEKGLPFGIRIVTTTKETYVIMSCNIDLGATNAFLQSFQLLPAK